VARSAQTVFGLDGATGQPVWRCDGTGHVRDVIATGGAFPARIALTDDASVVIHESLPADVDGGYEN
jgi:hypothetical protein